jgi:hypothetical protein
VGVFYAPETPFAKERTKWETGHTEFGPPGKPPYVFQPFPEMMYKATRDAMGRVSFEGIVAEDETEQRNLQSRGFVGGGRGAAIAALEAQEGEIAKLAANRAFNDRRLSEKAQAEAESLDILSDAHMPEIPVASKREKR